MRHDRAAASLDKEFSSSICRGERFGAPDDAMSAPMASRQGRWTPAASTTQRAILA